MAVEYIRNVPVVEIAGEKRLLGALAPDERLRGAFPLFGSSFKKLPRSEWVKRDFRHFRAQDPRRDQRRTSSCAGQASINAFGTARAIAGMPYVRLSATFPYAQVNGGRDEGASVSAHMEVLKQLGTCSDATVGLDKLFKKQIPAAAYKEAEQMRLQEAYICRSFDEYATAITLNYACAIGIMIGQNFGRLDRNGIAPLPDVSVGGHAMAVVGLDFVAGEWVLLLENSWGTGFGFDGGFCYITERHTLRMLDGFALVVPRESDAKGDDEPPVVPTTVKTTETLPVHIEVDKPEDEPPPVPKTDPMRTFKAPPMEELLAKQRSRFNLKPAEPKEAAPSEKPEDNQSKEDQL